MTHYLLSPLPLSSLGTAPTKGSTTHILAIKIASVRQDLRIECFK